MKNKKLEIGDFFYVRGYVRHGYLFYVVNIENDTIQACSPKWLSNKETFEQFIQVDENHLTVNDFVYICKGKINWFRKIIPLQSIRELFPIYKPTLSKIKISDKVSELW